MTKKYHAYISQITNLPDDLNACLDFIGWKNHVKTGSTVFIKPNFVYPYYKEGITTSPEFLRNLFKILKTRADRVIIGESDGGNNSFSADTSLKGHGMDKICKEMDIEVVNLSRVPSRSVEETIQGKKVKVEIPNLLMDEIDCFISVPILKVHAMTKISLSIKNLWGCNPDTMRVLQHKNLSRKLALITKSVNPKLVLIDGSFALNGHGPLYGTPIKTNLLIGSDNPVVADTLGTKIMGFNPLKIDHIPMAEMEGLGTMDLNNVIFNTSWEKYRMQFNVQKTFIDYLSTILFNSEIMAKLVLDSPFRPLIYSIAGKLRTKDETEVSEEIDRFHR